MPIRYKTCGEAPRGCGQAKLTSADPSVSAFWKDPKEPDGFQRYCVDCVKRVRRERADLRADLRAVGEELPAISDERRQQMSDNAKRLHAEGRFGGSALGRLGGRSRKPRLVDAVLDHFREAGKMDLIIQAYESNLRSRNRGQRLKAAEALTKMEFDEDKRMRESRGAGKSPDEMTQEELREFLEQGVAAMIESGELDVTALTLDPSAVREVS